MFSIGNKELEKLPYYDVDLAHKDGEYNIIHTNKNGTTEISIIT